MGGGLSNAPPELTSFVGRGWEVSRLRRLLKENRLVTLVGAGGCGKTRLAVHATAPVLGTPGRQGWFVDLAPLRDGRLVPALVAAAVGVREERGAGVEELLVERLRGEARILLLDNCEHLAAACAVLVEGLLRRCPELRLLATSRERLGVEGETVWMIPSLSYAPALSSLSAAAKLEAVRLFVQRARAADPGFELDDHNFDAVARICECLAGIPLALELAAGRAQVLTAAQILQHVEQGLDLLGEGARGRPARQQTLRATLDWSHQLLDPLSARVFRRAAAFSGSFDLAAADAVCGLDDLSHIQVLEGLTQLVRKCLLTADTRLEPARYRFLEPIRQYARENLAATGEEDRASRRHFHHYLGLVQEAEAHLVASPEQQAWLRQLTGELNNLRQALSWGLAGEPEGQAELATRLCWFWWFTGLLAEGQDWLARALETRGRHGTLSEAWLLLCKGRLCGRQQEHDKAERWVRVALQRFEDAGDAEGIGWALMELANAETWRGNPARAEEVFQQALTLKRQTGSGPPALYLEIRLAGVALDLGQYDRGRDMLENAISRLRLAGDRWGLALCLSNLGRTALEAGDLFGARRCLTESLPIMREFDDRVVLASLLEHVGGLLVAEGRPLQGLRLLAASAAQRSRVETRPRPAGDWTDWAVIARKTVSPAQATSAWAAGLQLDISEAVEAALTPAAAATASDSPALRGLTRREREVALLIARGLSNAEIAGRLFLSERTVENHVHHILTRLDFRSRAQVASWVSGQGLAETQPSA